MPLTRCFRAKESKKMLRPIIASTVLGALIGAVLAAGVLFAGAADSSNTVSIDNFTFTPKP